MSLQATIAFLFFAISMSLTPGAGNIAILGISNRYGFFATLPFIAGTALGVAAVFIGVGAGLIKVFELYPYLYSAIKYIGAIYLFYIAWEIANSLPSVEQKDQGAFGYISGASIQIFNPKSWIAATTVISQFVNPTENIVVQLLTIILMFTIIVFISNLIWAYCGSILKLILSSEYQMKILNRFLGLLLALTVVFMLSQS